MEDEVFDDLRILAEMTKLFLISFHDHKGRCQNCDVHADALLNFMVKLNEKYGGENARANRDS